MEAALTERRKNLQLDVKNYKKSLLEIYQSSRDKAFFGKLKQVANKKEAASDAFVNDLQAGDIVQYKNASGATVTTLWTGTRYQ